MPEITKQKDAAHGLDDSASVVRHCSTRIYICLERTLDKQLQDTHARSQLLFLVCVFGS